MSTPSDVMSEAGFGIAMHGVLCGLAWKLVVDILQDCRSSGNFSAIIVDRIGILLFSSAILFLLGMLFWTMQVVLFFQGKKEELKKHLWIARNFSFLLFFIGLVTMSLGTGYYLANFLSRNAYILGLIITATIWVGGYFTVRWIAGRIIK